MSKADNSRSTREAVELAKKLVINLPDGDMRAAFLFGSYAWGDADEASDLDLMLLLDRPNYREVSRVRISDVLDSSLASGPLFADLDKVSMERFNQAIASGRWHERVANSIVLVDTQNQYKQFSHTLTARWRSLEGRKHRFGYMRNSARLHLDASCQELERDPILAHLNGRLALQITVAALLELSDDRYSVTHFVESTDRILTKLGRQDLYSPLLRALALDAGVSSAERGMKAYKLFADTLIGWLVEPEIEEKLSHDAVAQAKFVYSAETYEEIKHKLAAFSCAGRDAAMVGYVDGLLQVPLRTAVSMVLSARDGGEPRMMTGPEFHTALRAEPPLFSEWVEGLRLTGLTAEVLATRDLAESVLKLCESVIGAL